MSRLATAKVILCFCLLTVLDGVVMPALRIGAVYPSFLALFVCYAAFEWGAPKTVYIAFWAGLLRDLLGGGLIGLDAALWVLLALGLDFLVQKMEREVPWIYFIITFLFVLFAGLLRCLVGLAEGLPASLFGEYLGMMALTALYTSVFLPVFSFLANGWFGHVATKQYELFR